MVFSGVVIYVSLPLISQKSSITNEKCPIFIVAELVSIRAWTRTQASWFPVQCTCDEATLTLADAREIQDYFQDWVALFATHKDTGNVYIEQQPEIFPSISPHFSPCPLHKIFPTQEPENEIRALSVSGCNFIHSFINIYSFWLGG